MPIITRTITRDGENLEREAFRVRRAAKVERAKITSGVFTLEARAVIIITRTPSISTFSRRRALGGKATALRYLEKRFVSADKGALHIISGTAIKGFSSTSSAASATEKAERAAHASIIEGEITLARVGHTRVQGRTETLL